MKNIQTAIDKASIGVALLCMAHCLLLPLVMVVLPLVVSLPIADESFHKALIYLVIPMSIIAFTLGCRKHKNWSIMVWGLIGLTILALTALFAHDVVGELGEKLGTVLGSVFIIFGHFKNYRLCEKSECQC